MEDIDESDRFSLFEKLEQFNLMYVKLEIFLYLDYRTLHTCRQVSSEWNDFIQNEIWKLRKKHMRSLLNKNWKSQNFYKQSINCNLNSGFYIVADAQNIGIGTKVSTAILLNIEKKTKTAEFVITLNDLIWDLMDEPENDIHDEHINDVQVDMTDKVIVAVAGSGLVKIWDRDTKTVLFSGAPHGHDAVLGVRIINNFIVTGGNEGGLAAYTVHSDNNGVDLVYNNRSAVASVAHLDSDGVRVLVGTHVNMVMWDFSDRSAPVQVSSVDSGQVCCCVMSYPHAFCTGLFINHGLQVWNMVTRNKIR